MCQEEISEIISELLNALTEQKLNSHDYNILTVLGVDDKEVRICRLIGDLLDPNGAHGLGAMPLERFLDELHILNEYQGDLKNSYVVLEDIIDSNRRVDIAIYMEDNVVIPVEAKIYAGDQDSQLFDYYNYYKNSGKTIDKIYYLTPSGNDPSKNSRGDLADAQFATISFSKTIRNWLEGILKKGVHDIRVKSLIEQFIEVILKMSKDATITEIVCKGVDFSDTDKEKNFEILYSLFNNANSILKMLRQKYAKQYIKIDKERYAYEENDITPISYNEHVVFRITKKTEFNEKIWLCFENAGFYIMAEPTNVSDSKALLNNGWKKEKGCYWKRIYTQGHRPITMNSIDFAEVDISAVLDEI